MQTLSKSFWSIRPERLAQSQHTKLIFLEANLSDIWTWLPIQSILCENSLLGMLPVGLCTFLMLQMLPLAQPFQVFM